MQVTSSRFAVPAVLLAVSALPACAATVTVGPGKQYATVSAAVAAASGGDEIDVSAGTYTNDFSNITVPLTLVAVGGRVLLRATEDVPNEKGIWVTSADVTATGFDFAGARTTNEAGQNAAGIRYQGGNLTLHACWFHNNQEGLLADAVPAGNIAIYNSEFGRNGDATGPGAGYTHDIYVNQVASLYVESSWFHDARIGHDFKTRAAETTIVNSRFTDLPTSTASYSIDAPNGGVVSITGSSIQQGQASQNPVIVSFGEEGNLWPSSSLTIASTLVENNLTSHTPLFVNDAAGVTAALQQLQVYGLTAGQLVNAPATLSGITYLGSEPTIPTNHPWQ